MKDIVKPIHTWGTTKDIGIARAICELFDRERYDCSYQILDDLGEYEFVVRRK